MHDLQVTGEGNLYTVYLDAQPVRVNNPDDLVALTLDVRDKDHRFYEALMHSEEFRRAMDRSSRTVTCSKRAMP